MKLLLTTFLSFTFFTNSAQIFYANIYSVNDLNATVVLNAGDCNFSQPIYTCPLQTSLTDIALDNSGNIYYLVADGGLIKRSLSDTNSCQYLGSFNANVTSLVADLDGNVYAAGWVGNNAQLYIYKSATKTFATIGNFPPGMFSLGDLFLYEGKLFLLSTVDGGSCIVNVNVVNPLLSCCYLSTGGLFSLYGAFSVWDGNSSKVFITSEAPDVKFNLHEVDMVQNFISPPVCQYPYYILGAASTYNYTPSIDNKTFCTIVPIELMGFNFETLNDKVKLSWQTASENNNCCFLVQRSFDALHYETLDTIAGSFYSNQIKYYSYDDKKYHADNYYRLIQKDYDGKIKYSKVLHVKIEQSKFISISPNPGKGFVHIYLPVSSAGTNLAIFDCSGKLINKQTLKSTYTDVDISFLKKGLYIFRFKNKNGEASSLGYIKE